MKPMDIALIVESDPDVAALLKEIIMEETDFVPIVTSTCKEALRLARGEARVPQLVVCDYTLADTDGLDCLYSLREIRKTRQPQPVAFVMANKEFLEVMATQGLHILEKPINYQLLRDAIRNRDAIRKNSAPRRRREKKPGRQEKEG